MQLFSGPLRPHRPGEWTAGGAILFIVTLAAKGSVTLAARAAGMSRKSAYALRKRDPLFARAWEAAASATAAAPSNGDVQGDNANLAASSTSSTATAGPGRAQGRFRAGPAWRDRLHAELRRARRDSAFGGVVPRLAPGPASR
jgi:hypothetical protein